MFLHKAKQHLKKCRVDMFYFEIPQWPVYQIIEIEFSQQILFAIICKIFIIFIILLSFLGFAGTQI